MACGEVDRGGAEAAAGDTSGAHPRQPTLAAKQYLRGALSLDSHFEATQLIACGAQQQVGGGLGGGADEGSLEANGLLRRTLQLVQQLSHRRRRRRRSRTGRCRRWRRWRRAAKQRAVWE